MKRLNSSLRLWRVEPHGPSSFLHARHFSPQHLQSSSSSITLEVPSHSSHLCICCPLRSSRSSNIPTIPLPSTSTIHTAHPPALPRKPVAVVQSRVIFSCLLGSLVLRRGLQQIPHQWPVHPTHRSLLNLHLQSPASARHQTVIQVQILHLRLPNLLLLDVQ